MQGGVLLRASKPGSGCSSFETLSVPPNDISPLGELLQEINDAHFHFCRRRRLSAECSACFAAGGYAFQTDPLPAEAGEHVAGNLSLDGQQPGSQRLNGQQQVQINALRSENLGTYLWSPSQGNGN